MPARRRRSSSSTSAAPEHAASSGGRDRRGGRGNAARAAAVAETEPESRGVWGWFQDAGQWVGDQAAAATTAVKETVQGAADTASDLWDVATSSDVDVDWATRSVTLDTDLDEVMDLMPASVAQALQLDRAAADNRVRAVYDHRAGTVTLTADQLELAGVQADGLTAGPVSLRGVRLVLSNPGGGVPFVGEDTGVPLWQDSDDSLAADLTVAGLEAHDVVTTGPNGPVRLARVSLTDLTGQATDNEQGLGGDGLVAGFSVSSAILQGVAAQGGAAARVTATDLSAGISAPGESAFLAAGSLSATGASQGGASLADARVDGARVDVANGGGGMPFFDARADSISATATARSASMGGLDTAGADLASGSATGLRGQFSGSSARVTADTVRGAGLDTASVDAATVGLDGAAADLGWGSGGLSATATAQSGAATGLQTDRFSADAVRATALSADHSADRMGAAASRIDVDGARVGDDVQLDQATIHDASAGLVGDRGRVVAREATASGARYRDTVQADDLSMAVFDARFDGSSATVDAARVRAGGLDVRDGATQGAARSVEALGTSATFGPAGISGSADRVLTEAARYGDISTERGEASGLSIGHADGVTQVGTDHVALDGFASPMARAGRLQASGGRATLDGADMDAALDRVSLTDGTIADRMGVGSATFDGLRAGRTGGVGRVGFDQAQATDLSDRTSGARAASASISAFDLAAQGGVVSASAGGVGATDVQAGGARAASLSGAGVRSQWDGRELQGGLDQLSMREGAFGDQASVGSADVSGLSVVAGADRQSAAFTSASARDAAWRGGGTAASAAEATVTGGAVQRDSRGVTGGASRVHAHDVRGRSSGAGGGGSSVDGGRLAASAAGLVDDASLRASVPMRPGKMGPVTARQGTTVDARIGVRDGRFVPGQTSAQFSRPLDGPAWTSASGVYMTDDHRLKADVNGWFDKDVGGSLNESLGIRGRQVPSVGALGSALARGGGGGGSGPSPVDLSRATGSGQVSLRGGTLDAGQAGSATLSQPQRAGDNTLGLSYSGQEGLGVSAERLRLDGAQASGAQAGSTAIDDARVRVGPDGTTSGSASQIDARDVRFGTRR